MSIVHHEPWKRHALSVTEGTQTGAILRAAMGYPTDTPASYARHAVITSDGFLMCDYCDRERQCHMGAFVGTAGDLVNNVDQLVEHLNLSRDERACLYDLVRGWVHMDWRSLPGLHFKGETP